MKPKHKGAPPLARTLTAIGLAALLSACGGSLMDTAGTASPAAIAAAASTAFEDVTDAEGKTVSQLKRVVALTPLVNGAMKPYFEARKVEVVQASLEDMANVAPAVLYIDTSLYNTESKELKEYLLKFNGVLILDGPAKLDDPTSQVNKADAQTPPPANYKAMALMMNLGISGVIESDIFIITREKTWVTDAENLLIGEFFSVLDRSIYEISTSVKNFANLAKASDLTRGGFFDSSSTTVHQNIKNPNGSETGWYLYYELDLNGHATEGGGTEKVLEVNVNMTGANDGGNSGGFRRWTRDWNRTNNSFDWVWSTQQRDHWLYDYNVKNLKMSADQLPFKFELEITTALRKKSGSFKYPQPSDRYLTNMRQTQKHPETLNSDHFKKGSDRVLTSVFGASFTIPGNPFGVNAGIPQYKGGYTDQWKPHIGSQDQTWESNTYKYVKNSWGIHLKEVEDTEGVLFKGFDDRKRNGDCDVQGHSKGGCLNERINKLSKDGYSITAGHSVKVKKIAHRFATVKVKPKIGFMDCAAREVVYDRWYTSRGYGAGCWNHREVSLEKNVVYDLTPRAYAWGWGAMGDFEPVTENQVMEEISAIGGQSEVETPGSGVDLPGRQLITKDNLCVDSGDGAAGYRLAQCNATDNNHPSSLKQKFKNWWWHGQPIVLSGNGQCLTPSHHNLSPGVPVHNWNCEGNSSQAWKILADGRIQSQTNPSLCIVASHHRYGQVGNHLHVWDCNDAGKAKFKRLLPDYQISPNHVAGKCMDARDTDQHITNVDLWDCHGGANQKWSLETINGQPVVRVGDGNMCLQVANNNLNNGSRIHTYPCHHSSQMEGGRFFINGNNDLVSAAKPWMCVDVAGFQSHNGAGLHLWDCHGGQNQKWTLTAQ